ncbi:SGNH/GDSL hydrolase family protein [Chitinophaga flava]|uniref:SGNH hydrolase-type esterase domain-containing protein n=1 Tax=Chitinophaga flava TaxID=2259036 RepID=A0A365Y5E9_9BACT|nr:SGNH/GDSL hydrolase family protein [Chitinophaga flava]RBL93822.1 hypothetical protein DF182_15110 [Chitinophaga flava]
MKITKIQVIGGCHIAGYGLQNQKDNFVDVLMSSVNSEQITFVKKTQAYVSLKKFFQEANNIHEFSPDILLIQLGNHEFTINLRAKLFSYLKIKQEKKVGGETSPAIPYPPGATVVSKPKYFKILVYSSLKLAFDSFLSFTKKNMQQREVELKQFIDILDQLNYNIILLPPLPSLDRFTQKSRKSAVDFIKNYDFKNKKVRYIDSHALIPLKRTYFQDGVHLNKEGHMQVANKLQSIFNELSTLNQSETFLIKDHINLSKMAN